MRAHDVRALLMGGQACILYGAAEFSRDTDFAVLASTRNLARLRSALVDLDAHVIAVPPFDADYLRRGHAVHFRAARPEVAGLRIDVMTKMRGVDGFAKLWARRTTVDLEDGRCEVMALPDLVKAKKTQRDKDWPMIRRLVEASWFEAGARPARARIDFWLRELRTPELLLEAARRWPSACTRARRQRPLLKHAAGGHEAQLVAALTAEEWTERQADAAYWKPLKEELERLRHGLRRRRPPAGR